MSQESKRERWYRLMQEYEGSGKSVAAWCAEVGCTYHMFKYWRYRIRIQETYIKAGLDIPAGWVSASLPASRQAEITVRAGSAEITVPHGFDRSLLREVVEALS
jgi:hypothetical protein